MSGDPLDVLRDVDQVSTIIYESLMGYAPGTTEQVRPGTWNAFDDEIDTVGIARELRDRLLGPQEQAEMDEHQALMDHQREAAGPDDSPAWYGDEDDDDGE